MKGIKGTNYTNLGKKFVEIVLGAWKLEFIEWAYVELLGRSKCHPIFIIPFCLTGTNVKW